MFRPFDYRSVDVCFQIEIMPLKCLAEILAVWCISCCSRQVIFATKSSLPNIITLDQRIKASTESTQWEMTCAAIYVALRWSQQVTAVNLLKLCDDNAKNLPYAEQDRKQREATWPTYGKYQMLPPWLKQKEPSLRAAMSANSRGTARQRKWTRLTRWCEFILNDCVSRRVCSVSKALPYLNIEVVQVIEVFTLQCPQTQALPQRYRTQRAESAAQIAADSPKNPNLLLRQDSCVAIPLRGKFAPYSAPCLGLAMQRSNDVWSIYCRWNSIHGETNQDKLNCSNIQASISWIDLELRWNSSLVAHVNFDNAK